MTTARNVLQPQTFDQIHAQTDLARSAPSYVSSKKAGKSQKTQAAAAAGSKQRAPHHGLYGGHVNGFTTPYIKPPPDLENVPQETTGKRYRPLYRRKKLDGSQESVVQDANLDDDEPDYDDKDDTSSWSQPTYDAQTLSTIPEVPSTLPAGTLTPSTLDEIYPSKERGRASFGSSLAKIFFDRRKRNSSSGGAPSYKLGPAKGDDLAGPTNANGATIGCEELRDFEYKRIKAAQRGRILNKHGQGNVKRGRSDVKTRGHCDVEQSSSSFSSASSSHGTSTPSPDPVGISWPDRKRLAAPPSSITSNNCRKLYVLVAVVVSVIVVIVVVTVVVIVALLSTASVDGQSNSTQRQSSTSSMILFSAFTEPSIDNQSNSSQLNSVTSSMTRYSPPPFSSTITLSADNRSPSTQLNNSTSSTIRYSYSAMNITMNSTTRTASSTPASGPTPVNVTSLGVPITGNLSVASPVTTGGLSISQPFVDGGSIIASSPLASRLTPTNVTSSSAPVNASFSVTSPTASQGQTTALDTSQQPLVDKESSIPENYVTSAVTASPTDSEPSTITSLPPPDDNTG